MAKKKLKTVEVLVISTVREIIEVTHKGVKVLVEINYDLNQISFVERFGNSYIDKKWSFANRGSEYMGGWINILEALKVATQEAHTRMFDYQYKKEKEEQEKLIEKIK